MKTKLLKTNIFDFTEEIDDDNWIRHLDEKGFVVFKNILTSLEYDTALNMFWKMMASLNPNIDRNDRATWTNRTFPGEYDTGINSYYGMCQSDFCWNLRTNPKFKKIFSYVYSKSKFSDVSHEDVKDLCCSMDAINIMFDKRNFSKDSWIHEDQALELEGGDMLSIQGAFNFYPVNEDDGGFILVPSSHLEAEKRMNKRRKLNDIPYTHYVVIEETDELCKQPYKLELPMNGTFVLWNSKTLHANVVGTINYPDRLNRLSLYIAMQPKSRRSLKVKREKEKMYLNNVGSTHWANKAIPKLIEPIYGRSINADTITALSKHNTIPNDILELL